MHVLRYMHACMYCTCVCTYVCMYVCTHILSEYHSMHGAQPSRPQRTKQTNETLCVRIYMWGGFFFFKKRKESLLQLQESFKKKQKKPTLLLSADVPRPYVCETKKKKKKERKKERKQGRRDILDILPCTILYCTYMRACNTIILVCATLPTDQEYMECMYIHTHTCVLTHTRTRIQIIICMYCMYVRRCLSKISPPPPPLVRKSWHFCKNGRITKYIGTYIHTYIHFFP